MFKKRTPWYRRIAEHRRPEFVSDIGMFWKLLYTRWFGLALVLRFRSDTTFDQIAESNRLRFVLEGEYIQHREIAHTGGNKPAEKVPEHAYVYSDQYGLYVSERVELHWTTFEPEGRRGGVELMAAENVGQQIVDFPNWMQHDEVIFDAERPCFMLVISWGGVWRS